MLKSFKCVLLFLLIVSLVSCNTIPPPISDETTGNSSTAITTAELTTEAVTTEEMTTEEATTAEETLDLDPDWVNDTTPAAYRYLDGLPNDKWYFDWNPSPYGEYRLDDIIRYRNNYPYTEECELYAIQTPLRYETEKDGLLFRFEFFEEKHISRSMMQIRITVINVSKEPVKINDTPLYDTYIVRNNAGPYRSKRIPADFMFDLEERKLWVGLELESALKPFTLSYGESYTFDRVARIFTQNPSDFQGWTHLEFYLYLVDRTPDDGVQGKSVTVQVPITAIVPDDN